MNPIVQFRVGREGDQWIAVATIETQGGPLLVTATASQAAIEAALATWHRHRGGHPIVGALPKLQQLAKTVAKTRVLEQVQASASEIVKSPALARAAREYVVSPEQAKL